MMLKQQQQLGVCINLSADTIAALRRQIHGCEICSENATLPFAQLLIRLTGHIESSEESMMISDDIQCPSCINPLDIDTLVELQKGIGRAASVGRVA
jgi:hypothetical protein